MKRIAVLLLSFAFASSLFAAPTQRYIVMTRAHVGAGHALDMIRGITPEAQPESRDITTFNIIEGFAADLTADEAAALKKTPGVRYVEQVIERHAMDAGGGSAPAVEATSTQTVPFGIDLVHARDVWPVTRGRGINVVVVDTGVDYHHPDLAAIFAGGYNTYDKSTNPMDDNGHGTHVSGTIAAQDNDVGVVGVAPDVHLWAVKVLDSSGSGTTDKIIAALDWIEAKKADLGGDWVLNFSLGATQASTAERAAFGKAVDSGLLICAASGNESTDTVPAPVGYPAAYRGVLAIGAVDKSLNIASFSDQGPELAVVAPGVAIRSTLPVGTGSISSVTSGSTTFTASEVELSKKGTVTAAFVDCAQGHAGEFPASVAGRIALIQRGDISFNEKAHNALDAGAIGIVIYNNTVGDASSLGFTLNNATDPAASTTSWPVTVAVSQTDGATILASKGTITITNTADDYGTLSGTSMATPHAVGVAALVWSAAPLLSASDIGHAIMNNADDLGAPGFDTVYGNGMIDALRAAKSVAPASFGSPATPPAPGSRPRSVRRR
ncbi:MAG TPA: S8 family serine peptidase [Thermoanaerobaculia bacterium]